MVFIPSILSKYPEIEEAFEACRAASLYAFDAETSSFNPFTGKIIGFSVAVDTIQIPCNCFHNCCPPETLFPKAWYFQFVPSLNTHLSHDEAFARNPRTCVPFLPTMKLFGEVWADRDKECVYHNGKFDIKFQRRAGFEVDNRIIDTAVASWLLDEERGTHKLKNLVKMLLGHDMATFEEMGSLFGPPIEVYGADDACQTLRLWRYFEPSIRSERLEKVFKELECEIVGVLADMELRGTRIDIKLLEELRGKIADEADQVEQECYALAGQRFGITAPQQVGTLLFDVLQWPKRGQIPRTKDKLGWRTNKEILARYEDKPLAKGILRHRELLKFESTYIDPLIRAAQKLDGRVRSRFNQIPDPRGGGGTVSGRLSSNADEDLGGCNFQNIPSRSKTGKQIRFAFIPAPEFVYVVYDYSQIELRFMAHYSQDRTLLAAYRNWECAECGERGGTKIGLRECPNCHAPEGHRTREKKCKTCQDYDGPEDRLIHGFCLGLDIHQITADACGVERYLGKIVNFALLYGLGAEGLSRKLNCSVGQARKIRDAYFRKYSGIQRHNGWVQTHIMRTGEMPTILKRKRRFPHIKGKRLELWDREWRQGANNIIQGSAADLMKVAMRNVHRRLRHENLHLDTGLVLQVHDEMTVETPQHRGDYISTLVRDEMENAFRISVPIIAEGGVSSKSWGDAKQ